MNKNVLIAFGGATLIAIVVAMLLSAMLKSGKDDKKVAEEAPKTQILVASDNIAVGNLLTEENIKWKTWPLEAAYPGTVQRKDKEKPLEALSGRAIRPLIVDEPIVSGAIVSDDGGFLAAALEPGYRAVAVSVAAATMVGGFINPGDYVDVLMTYKVSVSAVNPDPTIQTEMQKVIDQNVERYATETVLQNIKVLGIDQRASKGEETGAKVGKTMTLQVTEHDAEVLALAAQMGELSLSLRALGDDKILTEHSPVVSDARIIRMNKEIAAEMNKVAESSGARQYNVRIYNGGDVTNLPTR
ncbi:MAG: Flp pilus assembly protein CpaB [Micavibrio sp.]